MPVKASVPQLRLIRQWWMCGIYDHGGWMGLMGGGQMRVGHPTPFGIRYIKNPPASQLIHPLYDIEVINNTSNNSQSSSYLILRPRLSQCLPRCQ